MKDLREIKTLVTHQYCHDGVASALLVKDVVPNIEVIWLTPGSLEHKTLSPRPNCLWCDIVPHPSSAEDWVAVEPIVLDHHVGNASTTALFGDNSVFLSQDGVCGATLAFQYVWKHLADEGKRANQREREIEGLIKLVGIKDTNLTSDKGWKDSSYLQQALTFYNFEELSKGFPSIYEEMKVGKLLLEKETESVKKAVAESYRFSHQGKNVICFMGTRLSSDVANLVDQQYDIVVGCGLHPHRNNQISYRFSIRSHSGFDCAKFTAFFGGGGHKEAAGMSIIDGMASSNPFAKFENLFRIYLEDEQETNQQKVST